MRNVLIINGNGFTPCSNHCGALISLLRRAQPLARIRETSIESPSLDGTLVPDLIVPRIPLRDWTRKGIEFCKKSWASTKTFAVVCEPAGRSKDNLPPALFDVDELLFCPYEENEFLLRLKRLVRKDDAVIDPCGSSGDARGNLELLVGESETFLRAVRKVGLLAKSKAPVVISGETGSGKELFARAIHYQSSRRAKPFIPVNCGALPDELFENELFGHLKGAYTSASSAEKGLIAEAEGGTLFLDEVDTLSPAAQIKLLRFLQSGEYRPLGSSRSVIANVRIIAATNTELGPLVELKMFREDLHYRLNVLSLSIPALRNRDTDVLQLASHFLVVYSREHERNAPELSASAHEKLLSHSWPGNVRELEGVIQRAIVMHSGSTLRPDDLELQSTNGLEGTEPELFRQGKSMAIGQFERNFVVKLLAAHGGNVSRAARAAGKDRRSFQRLLHKYALDRKSFEH